jgi:hypothetical protein
MKWLLLVLVFRIGPEGDMQRLAMFTKVYTNQGECDAVGTNFRTVFKNIPADAKSVSFCVPESAYREQGWRER